MSNRVLVRIMGLIACGYEVRIRPDVLTECIEVRLIKDKHTIAQIIDLNACERSHMFKSDEEWFLYALSNLEFKFQNYFRELKNTRKDQ